MSHWKGKNAIVCGASSGLGLALTRELAKQGAKQLVLLARNKDALTQISKDLQTSYSSLTIQVYSADLTDQDSVIAAANEIMQHCRPADLLIQAVGKSDRGTLTSLTEAKLDELVKTNITSSLHALQHIAPTLRQPGSSVVLIGSLASKFAPRFLGGYSIAKHGLAALAGQARLELSENGTRVTLACPGPIARPDAGTRYSNQATDPDLPAGAMAPGGGAKIKGLDPSRLAIDILAAAAKGKPEIIRPRKGRLLMILAAISPRLGDWLLRRKSA